MMVILICMVVGMVTAITVAWAASSVSDRSRRLKSLGVERCDRKQQPAVTARYRKLVADQMEGCLLLLAGLIGAGVSPAEGIRLLVDESPPPVQGVFSDVCGKYDAGTPLVECLRETGEQTGIEAFCRLALAVDVCQVTGGDLVPVIESIADRISEDAELERELGQRTAELKFTGKLLLAMPWALFGLTAVVNDTSLGAALGDPLGRSLLLVALAVWLVGWYVMRRILSVDRVLGGGLL